MTDRQFRTLVLLAVCYLCSQMTIWLSYGVYLWLTGRM